MGFTNSNRIRLQKRIYNLDGDEISRDPLATFASGTPAYATDAFSVALSDNNLTKNLVRGHRLGYLIEQLTPTEALESQYEWRIIGKIPEFPPYENLPTSPTYWFDKTLVNVQYPAGTAMNDSWQGQPADQRQWGDTITFSGAREFYQEFMADGTLDNLHFGGYRIKLYHGNSTDEPPMENAQSLPFQLRAIELTKFGPTAPWVDLQVSNPKVDVQGAITVYPNRNHTGVEGWTPAAGLVSYRIRIGHPELDPQDWITVDGTAATSSPDNDGVVASILETDIDLTPLVASFAALSQPLPDILLLEGRAMMDTENGGNTITPLARALVSDDDRELRDDDCQPEWTCNVYGLPNFHSATMSGVPEASQRFTGNNRLDSSGSMGGGWQLAAYKKLEEDEHGNLTFHDGNGRIERWLPEGSSYLPAHKNNRITAEKVGDTFTLTFPDKSEMFFEEENPGKTWKITTWTDSNGVVTTYSYDTSTDKRLTSVNDGLGRQTNFHYASPADRQPSSISSHTGTTGARTTSFTYHPSGQLATITNPEGEATSYAYTSDNRIQSVTDPIGVAIAYTYYPNPDGRVHTETFYGLRQNTYVYDDINQKLTVTESDLSGAGAASPRTTEYHYDGYRNVIKIVDPLGNEIHQEFNDRYDPQLLTSVTTPNGTTRYTYNAKGMTTSVTDAFNNTSVIDYTDSNVPYLPTAITRPANGGRTEITYDTAGNVKTVKDALGQFTTMDYDSQGFLTSVTDRNGSTTEFIYGGSPKNLTSIRTPKEGGGFRTVSFEYDGFDNVTRAYDDLGQEVKTKFDKLDRAFEIEDARGKTTEFEFDPLNGLLNKVFSPANTASGPAARETAMSYDSSGRLEEIFRELSSSTSTSRVKYEYDGFSQLKKLSRKKHSGASKAYELAYDVLGRVTSAKDTENKVSTASYAPFCLRQATDSARGIRTVSHFDALCRLVSLEVGTPDPTEALELATVTENRSFEYDDLGRLVSSTQTPATFSAGGRYGGARFGQAAYSSTSDGPARTYDYDALDRLTSVTFEDEKTATFEYWPEGQLKKMTDPEGKVTRYNYHPNGSLSQVLLERDEIVVGEFAYDYDEVGLPLSITYPASTGIVAEFQSASSARGWNANGQLLHLRYLKGGVPIREFEFDYDDSGNRTKQVESSAAGMVHWRYSYDYLDRLSKVEKGPSESLLTDVSIYSYDESDNRTVLELPQDLVKLLYSYDDADGIERVEKRNSSSNLLLSTETFTSDDDGNVISRFDNQAGVTIRYDWDGFNKLVAVSSEDINGPTNDAKQENSYLANGFRRKKKAKSGQVTTEYSAGLSTAMAKAGADTISYVQGHQILGFEKNDEFFFYLTDALGSVRDIVRGTDGAVLQSYDYRENGEKTASNPSGPKSDKTWVGGLSVNDDTADSGLYLMGHRHYDPELGRFISRDPIGFRGGLNLFNGASTSPVDLVDPDGLQPWPPDYNGEHRPFSPEDGRFWPDPAPGYESVYLPKVEFDRGCSFSECFQNCVDAHDPLSGTAKVALAATGAPIPKSALKAVGVKIRGTGGVSAYTSLPSVIAFKLPRGAAKRALRSTGRLASRVFVPYTVYISAVAAMCAVECKKDKC